MENCEDLTRHILEFFTALYAKDNQIKPSLENLSYSSINEENVNQLESDLLVKEFGDALFNLGGAKAWGSDSFLMVFLSISGTSWKEIFFFLKNILEKYTMPFLKEFNQRGNLSKKLSASFIGLMPKKTGTYCIKDFRTISLIGSIYNLQNFSKCSS